MPQAFQAELQYQVQELLCGHAGRSPDLTRLMATVRPVDPADAPDFVSRMRAALPWTLGPLVAGPPLTYHKMELAFQKGSPRHFEPLVQV